MAYLAEWIYNGEKHFERVRDKRASNRMKKNILFAFPEATSIKVSEEKELTYAEVRRLERMMGIKQ